MHTSNIALALLSRMVSICVAVVGLGIAPVLASDEPLVVDAMTVTLIDSVDVPAAENGIIAELLVREGQAVVAGQPLGSLDDRKARLEESLAKTQLEVARWRAENDLTAELAEKETAEQQQLANQHSLLQQIADQKAANEVRILASQKTEAVAKNELDRAIKARQEYVDSVSKSEIDALRLAHERTRLETRQAEFERGIDQLNSQAESEAALAHQLGIERSKIQLAQAVANQRVTQLQVQLQEHQSQLSKLATERHRITAPLDGVVVELLRKPGDWVDLGQSVVRLIRLNRLRAEGFVPFEMIDQLRQNRQVLLTIHTGPDSHTEREGTIVFISPEIDPVNAEVRFWVEFENPQLDVLPGMRLSLRSKS